MKMPIKMVYDTMSGYIEHETMSVEELIEALLKLNPKAPIRAVFDAGCASGDVKGIEKNENNTEYDIIVE
jgi:hypothetical protein